MHASVALQRFNGRTQRQGHFPYAMALRAENALCAS